MNVQIILPDSLTNPMGGMGEQCREILSCFPEGFRFDIIGSAQEARHSGRNYEYTPAADFVLPALGLDPLGVTLIDAANQAAVAMTRPRPDLVHAFDWSSFYAGLLVSRHHGVPFIVTVQLSIQQFSRAVLGTSTQNALLRLNQAIKVSGLANADAIIQVSRAYALAMPSLWLAKTAVIPNGIDLSKWQPTPTTLPGRRPFKLVYIGRFSHQKGILPLLRAALPETVDLILIGGARGSDPALLKEVRSATCDHVFFLGPKYGQEKIDLLSAADFQIVPSLHEPFGIVALEALAARNILLTSRVDGMGDFLDETNSLMCGTTAESITAALSQAAVVSSQTRAAMVEAGLQTCRQFTWERSAQALSDLYRRFSPT